MLIDFVELIWLVCLTTAGQERFQHTMSYHVQIRMSTEILVGLGSLSHTGPFS